MADNWPAVEVFRRCRLGVSVGYGGAIYTSIPRADISAMLDEIDLGDVPRLAAIDGVMVIESVALSELNSRA